MTKSIGTCLGIILLFGNIVPAMAQMTSTDVQTCNDSNATYGQNLKACMSLGKAMVIPPITGPVGAAMQGIDSKIKQTMDNGSDDNSSTGTQPTLPPQTGVTGTLSPTPNPSPTPPGVMQQLQQLTGIQTQTSGDDSGTTSSEAQSPDAGGNNTGQ